MLPLEKIKTEQEEASTSFGATEAAGVLLYIGKKALHSTMSLRGCILLHLSDDCLNEIFDLKRMSAVDLASVARTCTKFKEIATGIFGRTQTVFDLNSLARYGSAAACRVICVFGSLIVQLRINFELFKDGGHGRMIEAIIENCGALKRLHIKCYEVPDNPCEISKMASLFGKLEVLHLKDVYMEYYLSNKDNSLVTRKGNYMNFFVNCNSLVDFKIDRCFNLERCIFEGFFPKLRHFEYSLYDDRNGNVEGFIFRHRNLKSLSYNTVNYKNPKLLKVIANCCKQLEKLSLTTVAPPQRYRKTLNYITSLEHLEQLRIVWFDKNMSGLVENLQSSSSLKVLDLQHIKGCPELLPAITNLNALRVLKLAFIGELRNYNSIRNVTQLDELFIVSKENIEFDLVKVINSLVNLKKIKFHVHGHYISDDLYNQLVSVVKNRPVFGNRFIEVDYPGTVGDYFLCPMTVALTSLEYKI